MTLFPLNAKRGFRLDPEKPPLAVTVLSRATLPLVMTFFPLSHLTFIFYYLILVLIFVTYHVLQLI